MTNAFIKEGFTHLPDYDPKSPNGLTGPRYVSMTQSQKEIEAKDLCMRRLSHMVKRLPKHPRFTNLRAALVEKLGPLPTEESGSEAADNTLETQHNQMKATRSLNKQAKIGTSTIQSPTAMAAQIRQPPGSSPNLQNMA